MLTESKYIFFYILMALGLSSCTHSYYAPDEGNLIALKEKDDLKFSAALPDGDPAYSLQVGYSPVKHLGLQGSYFHYGKKGNSNNREQYGKGSIGSFLVGTYYTLSRDHQDSTRQWGLQESIMFDFYAGYSKGQVNNFYDPGQSSHFNFNKKYIQLGLHWQSRMIGVDVVTKLGTLDFNTGTVVGELDETDFKDIENLQQYDTYFIRETSFRIFVGLKKMRWFMTFTHLKSPELDKVRFIDRTFSIGTIIDIDELFRKPGY